MESVLRLMLALLAAEHQRPNRQMRELAGVIAAVTQNRQERVALVAVAYLESGFGRYGDRPFGVVRCRRWHCDTREEARIALRSLHSARSVCGSSEWRLRLSRYHNGRVRRAGGCIADSYGARAAAMMNRLN